MRGVPTGVGGVVRAALYKPLAQNDYFSISKIIKATENFFKKVAYTFVVYLVLASIFYPYLVNGSFDNVFTLSLVLIIGISTFFQYYFGITYQILLQSDQRQYITSMIQIVTTIINTVLIIVLIKFGSTIHIVKLASSAIFVLRPLLIYAYVNKKYQITKNCEPDNQAIKQRWDGLGHHIAFLIQNSTDVTVLTFFANIKEVSVYSVYYMIIASIKTITVTFSSSLEAAFGEMIAKNERESLDRNIQLFEFSSFFITAILFTSAAILILPFISLYTKGVTDVSYQRPLFAFVFIASQAACCIRVPYNSVVLAAGHYKRTRNGAFAEAIINIVSSVILVQFFGIVGVAIGSFCAMLFRTIQYVIYLSNNIIERSVWKFFHKLIVFSLTSIAIVVLHNTCIKITINTYQEWFLYAVIVTLGVSVVTFGISFVFYHHDIKMMYSKMKTII